MNSWADEFLVMIQAIVDGIEQFVEDRAKELEDTVDTLLEASEELAEQIEAAIAPELEQRMNEFFDPILEAYLGFEVLVEEAAQPMVNTVEPIINEHPACVGCRHYHGQSYNGVMLVCGMHPYGCEEEKCPDWESFWQDTTTD